MEADIKRLNPITDTSNEIVCSEIDQLKDFFKIPGNNIISSCFEKTDATSTIELFIFALSIRNVNQVDSVWLSRHLKTINSNKDINNIYGAIWEILFAGILIDSGIPVKLFPESNPGTDLGANIQGKGFNFSLKRYDKSAHYKNIELFHKLITSKVKKKGLPRLSVIIEFKKYPDTTMQKHIENLIDRFAINDRPLIINEERYLLRIMNSLGDDIETDKRFCSYQVNIISELHKNEIKNLYDKLDDAFYNLAAFRRRGFNVICVHINQYMPLEALESYAKEYLSIRKKKIDFVIFYQPCVLSDDHSTQVSHVLKVIFHPRFQSLVHSKGPIPAIKIPIGTILPESAPSILNIAGIQIELNKKYWFQNGEYYCHASENQGKIEGIISKKGYGILIHSVMDVDNKTFAVKGNFSETDELIII